MTKNQALNKVAQMCSQQEYSEFDIQNKLQRWEINNEDQIEIIATLYKHRLLDPLRYALAYTRDKTLLNKWGQEKIKMMLKRKKIPSDIITKALESIATDTVFENCLTLLKSKNATLQECDPYKRKAKLFRFALNRGFSMELIYRVFTKIDISTDNEVFT